VLATSLGSCTDLGSPCPIFFEPAWVEAMPTALHALHRVPRAARSDTVLWECLLYLPEPMLVQMPMNTSETLSKFRTTRTHTHTHARARARAHHRARKVRAGGRGCRCRTPQQRHHSVTRLLEVRYTDKNLPSYHSHDINYSRLPPRP